MIARLVACAIAILIVNSGAHANSQNDRFRLFKPGKAEVKWGPPALQTGAIITFGIVRPGEHPSHVRNCPDLRPIDDLLSHSGLKRSDFDRELVKAFALWHSAANITFRPSPSGTGAQIIIGAQGRPLGRAYTDIAYVASPGDAGPDQITRALICLNPRMPWKIGFDNNLSVYDLRYTLLHEIGHAIGLDHPGAFGGIMGFRYHEQYRTPQLGDISAARFLYGVPNAETSEKANSKSLFQTRYRQPHRHAILPLGETNSVHTNIKRGPAR